LKSDFPTVNWTAESEEIRQVYSTEILLNTATIKAVNSTEIDSNFTARETQDYAPSQRQATINQFKQTLTSSKHSIEFTYSDFPCHFKVNRDKLALTNRGWMCKKGKRLTVTANF